MPYVYDNAVVAKLAGAVNIGETQVLVRPLPAPYRIPPDPAPADVGILLLVDSLSTMARLEIVTYTGRIVNEDQTVLVTGVLRGQESTTEQSWAKGEWAYQEATAAVLAASVAPVAAHEATYDHTELHAQGTDQGLDTGGPSAVTAAQAKAAYDHSLLIAGDPHNVTKADVDLGNCDNTSDLAKPVSTATQTALDGKSNTGHNHALTRSRVSLTTANLTLSVGTEYLITNSGMTADRSLVVQAGTADGQEIVFSFLTDAPAAYETILIGDTGVTVALQGVDFTAAEVTKYFIKGEQCRMVWDATAAKWRIAKADDGRIPCLPTYSGTQTILSATATPADLSALAEKSNRGDVADETNDEFVMRRKALCVFSVYGYTTTAQMDTGEHLRVSIQRDSGAGWGNITFGRDMADGANRPLSEYANYAGLLQDGHKLRPQIYQDEGASQDVKLFVSLKEEL